MDDGSDLIAQRHGRHEMVSTGGPDHSFRYTGEQWDPNAGFYYNRARWMDPSVGRFLTLDSWPPDTTWPLSLHRYLYAGCSPVSWRDPTGNYTFAEVVVGTVLSLSLANWAHVYYLLGARAFAGGKPEIEWSGVLFIMTMGHPGWFGPEGAMAAARMTAKGSGGQQVTHSYCIAGFGLGNAPWSFTAGEITLFTPSIFGTNALVLAGPFTFMAGTVAARIGELGMSWSWGVVHMGIGMGEAGFSAPMGFDLGADWIQGVSIPCE